MELVNIRKAIRSHSIAQCCLSEYCVTLDKDKALKTSVLV
ncbi:MAG: hypothetical protein OFPI_33940 [Osedax symbiont Rs2]|nr:MAG: hypothetical protein OFPI_33940 [Osedax symbiont Rs2]